MTKRIFFDGLNLASAQGTGIATYTRVLTRAVRQLGYETGILYSTRRPPAKDRVLCEVNFFDERRTGFAIKGLSGRMQFARDFVGSLIANRPKLLPNGGVVIARQFQEQLPQADHNFISQNIFERAHMRFDCTGTFLPVLFDIQPDILHCTYQLPIKARSRCNIVTIHDLVALRLPFTTMDHKRKTYRLLRKVARDCDHIVTVSENSRRDIIQLLGVDESRVTNTFQSVYFPEEQVSRSLQLVADQLSGSLGLDCGRYFLFFGALEPKKNLIRLVNAYLASQTDMPLVLVTSEGWGNDAENQILSEREMQQTHGYHADTLRRRIVPLRHVNLFTLIALIRGARAVLFPSLYEGFGLPVLEAMALGTPAVTANTSSLPEIAGDAALMVDPYDVDAISSAITAIAQDDGLHAELSRRGLEQAKTFSMEAYRGRIAALYARLA